MCNWPLAYNAKSDVVSTYKTALAWAREGLKAFVLVAFGEEDLFDLDARTPSSTAGRRRRRTLRSTPQQGGALSDGDAPRASRDGHHRLHSQQRASPPKIEVVTEALHELVL